MIWILDKSLYGSKQGGRCWNVALSETLINMGFIQCKTDPCAFYMEDLIIAVYVDDILIIGIPDKIKWFKIELSKSYELDEIGELHHLLGLGVQCMPEQTFMYQEAYVDSLVEQFKLQSAKYSDIPMSSTCTFEDKDDSELKVLENQTEYRSIIGSLIYLANGTRPDISYAVRNLSQYVNKATKAHLTAAKKVIKYCSGTKNHGLLYQRDNNKEMKIEVFCDSGYGTGTNRRSISGIIIKLNGNVVSWASKRQDVVAQSTVEAEYIAMALAIKNLLWIIQLLHELGLRVELPVEVNEDNQGTIQLAKNPIISTRSKHIDIRYHLIRDVLRQGYITIKYCPTDQMDADIMTKPLPKDTFIKFKQRLKISNPEEALRGSVGK